MVTTGNWSDTYSMKSHRTQVGECPIIAHHRPVFYLIAPIQQNQVEDDPGLDVSGPCHMEGWCSDIIREDADDLRCVVLTWKEKKGVGEIYHNTKLDATHAVYEKVYEGFVEQQRQTKAD